MCIIFSEGITAKMHSKTFMITEKTLPQVQSLVNTSKKLITFPKHVQFAKKIFHSHPF